MFLPLSTYHPDNQPLGHFKNYPVYLATVLVVVHVASMLAGVVLSPQVYAEALQFAPEIYSPVAQPWRWITYAFVQVPTFWFLIDMYLLYSFGRQIEQNFGRRVLARLYGALILLPPLLVTIAFYTEIGNSQTLAGSNLASFSLFLGICLMNPGGLLFGIPFLSLKLVGPLLLGITALSYLAARDWVGLIVLLACVLLVYKMLRASGLPARFEMIKDALKNAMPVRKTKASAPSSRNPSAGSAGKSGNSPSKYYEPKIKPKPELAPERKVIEEIDAILEKITRSGVESLTPGEKAALQKASSKLKDTDY